MIGMLLNVVHHESPQRYITKELTFLSANSMGNLADTAGMKPDVLRK